MIANDFIYVTPPQITFSHQLGQTLPAAQTVTINSNDNWQASTSDNELTLSATSGNAGTTNVDIYLNTNADNLSAGQHRFDVDFENDNGAMVTLTVIVEISNSSGFAVSPNTLNFEWLRGSALPSSQNLHIFSDDAWSIVSKPNWLFVTPTSGSTSETLTVLPANVTSMVAGNYNGDIEFDYNGSSTNITVPVSLSVFNFLETDLEAGKFFFTRDDHWLNFTSNRDNTYIEITLNMLINRWDGSWQAVDRVYKLPLFQRKGKFHVGEVVHQFMDKISKDLTFPADVNATYQPAMVDIVIKEIDLDDSTVYFNTAINSVRFTKGKWDDYVLEEALLSRFFKGENDVLTNFFNRFADDTITFRIKVYRANNVMFENTKTGVYNKNLFRVKFELPSNLSIGDVFFMDRANIRNNPKKYIVFEKSNHFSKIIFENSYGLPEIFYTNGKWRLDANYKSFENKVRKDLAEVKETALVLATQKLIIHTGFIFNEEVSALDALMKSRQIYIYNDKLDGVQIRPVSKRIIAKDFESGMLNYKLEFELIENTDDQIYS